MRHICRCLSGSIAKDKRFVERREQAQGHPEPTWKMLVLFATQFLFI